MSNDLISRSAFVKEINEHMKNVYGCECDIESVSDFQDGNKSEESYIVQGLFEAFELIGNVPTTYDVDKVVERLEERKKYILKEFVLADKSQYVKDISVARINEIDGLVEIIKSGGIE